MSKNNESKLSVDDLIDCVDGLILILERDNFINCDAFDSIFNAKTCLKEIRKLLESHKENLS